MVELLLTRHGETQYNVKGVVQGIVNSNLTDRGAADAQALGRGFAQSGVTFDAAYASDLQRAVDTAQLALNAAGIQLPVTKMVGLREQNFGMFDGQPETQRQGALAKMLADAGVANVDSLNMKQMVDLVRILDIHHGHSTAENSKMSISRFTAAMTKIGQTAEQNNQDRVFIVAHGAIIWLFLNSLGMPDDAGFIKNVAVSKLIYRDGKFTIASINDRQYVELGGGTKNVPTQEFKLN
ncbi:histidine phosphatase family protein [Lacticaseibacillus hulanensis]|uniref:histidine phosphatase family protein n=1 Tax=Lacticaseibacillus hulanensis TaxID=2493111 RepID=UPI000FDB88E5|nr:histidine phosphatase family protein [Lacticaseibacillus hulanensis]